MIADRSSLNAAASIATSINVFDVHYCRGPGSPIHTWRGDVDFAKQQIAVTQHHAQMKYEQAMSFYRSTCGSTLTHRQSIIRMVVEAYHQFAMYPSRLQFSAMVPGRHENNCTTAYEIFSIERIMKSWRFYLSVLLKRLLSHLDADPQAYPTCVRLMALHGIYDASTPVKAHYIVTQKGCCTSKQLEVHFDAVEASRKKQTY